MLTSSNFSDVIIFLHHFPVLFFTSILRNLCTNMLTEPLSWYTLHVNNKSQLRSFVICDAHPIQCNITIIFLARSGLWSDWCCIHAIHEDHTTKVSFQYPKWTVQPPRAVSDLTFQVVKPALFDAHWFSPYWKSIVWSSLVLGPHFSVTSRPLLSVLFGVECIHLLSYRLNLGPYI